MSDETIYKVEVDKEVLAPGSNTPAIILISAGAALLVANLLGFSLMNYLWPAFIIGPGLLMLWPAFRSTREAQSSLSFLAVPGAVTTFVGGLLFIMNLTDHWEAWAYTWILLPAAAVAGVMYMKRFDEMSDIRQSGRRFIRACFILFLGLGTFFELIVFETFGPWWPLALIAYGAYLFSQNNKKGS